MEHRRNGELWSVYSLPDGHFAEGFGTLIFAVDVVVQRGYAGAFEPSFGSYTLSNSESATI